MAATFWLGTLLGELALAVALGWPVAAAVGGSRIALFAACTGAFLLVQALLVLIATLLARCAAGAPIRPLYATTIVMESIALLRAALRMSVHCGIGGEARGCTGLRGPGLLSRSAPRVVLIHGIFCNGGIWRPLVKMLHGAGFDRVTVMELQPPLADIETHASTVVARMQALQRRDGEPRAVIIAHSMGGLVARAALRAGGPAVIGRILTVGTPHHGTAIACALPFAPTRQMCPDSVWLRQLNVEQEGRLAVPFTCLYSRDDTLICPPKSAALAGARLVQIDGLGHLGLTVSPRALALLRDELLREQP